MIRSFVVSAVVSLAALSLVACEPSGGAMKTAEAAALPSGDAMPATYDWSFVAHGGSGDLDFGDGDWVEGVRIFSLSCLPESRTTSMSWGYQEEAVLTSGTATGTFQPGAEVATDHPVINALKESGAIDVGLSGADMRLVGKAEGKASILAFFDYCDTGRTPTYDEDPAAQAEANAAEIAAQVGPPAVEAPEASTVKTPEPAAPKT